MAQTKNQIDPLELSLNMVQYYQEVILGLQIKEAPLKPETFVLENKYQGEKNSGWLNVLEGDVLGIDVKRLYWLHSFESSETKGFHAHKNLNQLLVAMSGSVEIRIVDATLNEFEFILDSPSKVLKIPPLCWREIKMSPGACLNVLADQVFDEGDYIRSFDQFKEYLRGKS
ncbi:MAG: FdtA/QdtA family cupin domain-containing protein [Bdellovibrionales bacterium]